MLSRTAILFPLLAVSTLLGGCLLPMSPLVNEAHVVTPLTNQTSVVVFKEPEVWTDQIFGPTSGIRFPQGTYHLEAEDGEYRFFRAPTDLEYRMFQNGQLIHARFMPGGLCLSKHAFDLVPAGAYSFVDVHTNVLTWKLGTEFMHMEGGRWTKNF
jgi:hypothetical protein